MDSSSESDVGVCFQFANIFLPSKGVTARGMLRDGRCASSLLVQESFHVVSSVYLRNIECSLNVKFKD